MPLTMFQTGVMTHNKIMDWVMYANLSIGSILSRTVCKVTQGHGYSNIHSYIIMSHTEVIQQTYGYAN